MGIKKNIGLLGTVFPLLVSDVLIKTFTANGLEATVTFYAFYGAALLASGIAAHPRLLEGLGAQRRLFWTGQALAASLVVALLVFMAGGMAPGQPFLMLAALLAGLGIAGNYQQWFRLYAQRPLDVSVAYLLVMFSFSAALRLLISYLDQYTQVMVALIAVVVGQAANILAVRDLPGQHESDKARALPGQPEGDKSCVLAGQPEGDKPRALSPSPKGKERPLPFVVCLIAYSIVLAILRGLNFDSQFALASNQINLLMRIAFPLVVLFFVVFLHRTAGLVQLSQLSLIGIISLVLAVRFLAGTDTVLIVAFTAFIRSVVTLFLFMSLLLLVHRGPQHPLRCFGIGWGVYISMAGLGLLLSAGLSPSLLSSDAALNLVYILVVASLVPL
ncbi:MAG: hypothetical protein LBG81_05935, partial [Coriobacteriaceae bacterium]|nr:hypothetical protein [Coriobacteriaceae bacterium]